MEEDAKAEKLTDNWISTHLKYEGLQEVLKSLSRVERRKKREGPTVEEVNRDWMRLAALAPGRKNG